MEREVRNTRKLLRLLPVRKGECIKFKEDWEANGRPKYPRKLIIEVPIEWDTDWQPLCEKVWKTNKKKKIWKKAK